MFLVLEKIKYTVLYIVFFDTRGFCFWNSRKVITLHPIYKDTAIAIIDLQVVGAWWIGSEKSGVHSTLDCFEYCILVQEVNLVFCRVNIHIHVARNNAQASTQYTCGGHHWRCTE